MQTWLPSPIFSDSAKLLDTKRLGQQRVDTYKIMKILLTGKDWVDEPVLKMWCGYEWQLLDYQKAICREWKRRGPLDFYFNMTYDLFKGQPSRRTDIVPPWLGRRDVHQSHQSQLIQIDPWIYCAKFPKTPLDLPFVWPETEFSPVPF